MASLNHLPTELLLQICSILSSQRRTASLSRLSRTNRRLLALAQPPLYTSITHNEMPPSTQLNLLRTLQSRPDLASHIRHLSITTSISSSRPSSSTTEITTLLTTLNLPPRIHDLYSDPSDPAGRLLLLELILLHTPNLTFLQLPLNCEWDLPILTHLARQTPVSILLPKLHTLEITNYYISGDQYDVPFPAIISLCALAPNLQELWTYNPGSDGRGPYPLQSLKRLEFEDVCGVNEVLLRAMVESAPGLEVFGLVWHPAGDSYSWSGEGEAADAWKALWLRRETLREVRLDVLKDGWDGELRLGRLGWWSLGGFGMLEVLKVGAFALEVLREAWRGRRGFVDGGLGGDDEGFVRGLLPRSIREVTLWEPSGELVGGMMSLAGVVAQGEYPGLKRVVVAPTELIADRWHEEWVGQGEWLRASGELQRAFARSGVVFEVQTDRIYGGVRGPSWEKFQSYS
ncbi:hypothetical protein QBC34DRAFT_464132 [Podospora aff. communis PSN243]|uniref:F-box domain-containing protein n=1 Tax=Podospora aff. communis PSN243 TaxID=3040156 RepID=A0AAV9GLU2_9PEZI|nr:hypothetical protein QBC34DRAFT_464132 [Podospora aff. communis PSN243]